MLICDAWRCARGACAPCSSPACRRGRSRAAARERPFLSSAERAELAQASGLCSASRPSRSTPSATFLRALLAADRAGCASAGTTPPTTANRRCARCSSTISPTASSEHCSRGGPARRRHAALGGAAGGAPPRSQAALRAPRRTGPVIAPLAAPSRAARAARPRLALRLGARELDGLPGEMARRARACGPSELEPDADPLIARVRRARRARSCLRRPARAHRQRADRRREPAARRSSCSTARSRAETEPLSPGPAVDRTERSGQRQRPAPLPRVRAERPGPFEPREFELGFGMPDSELAAATLGRRRARAVRADRPHRRRSPRRRAGLSTTRPAAATCRRPLARAGAPAAGAVHARGRAAAGPSRRSAASTSRCGSPICARAGRCATTSTRAVALLRQRPPQRGGSARADRGAARGGARSGRGDGRRRARAAPPDLHPRGCLPPPGDLPRPGAMSADRFTAEQCDAIERRRGPLALAANAGSGKTSVLVERYVRAVIEDGIAPGADPRDHLHRPRRRRVARTRAAAPRRSRRARGGARERRPRSFRPSTASARGCCARTRCSPA